MLKTPDIDTKELYSVPPYTTPARGPEEKQMPRRQASAHLFKQLTRFGLVGSLNTLIDILALNLFLLLWPTTQTLQILIYNALAYGIGAANSFLCNKYWTFQQREPISRRELLRFSAATLCGMLVNSALLWVASMALRSLPLNATLWANASKVLAISATMLLSFLGMRLWVFTNTKIHTPMPASTQDRDASSQVALPLTGYKDTAQDFTSTQIAPVRERISLSIVLPAYNEEEVIAQTILDVLAAMNMWQIDYEILVVNDGSSDRTGEIIADLATRYPRVHLINHIRNQGYGAALVSGFETATKELTFFMDSDGQFDIRSLASFFPLSEIYDAVLGYRIKRQDAWMRKFNAWGWKVLVYLALGVSARDIDCAFKLFHTSFLHAHPLETRGAMINAELLYRLKEGNFTRYEIGVPHLPRQGGRATGARPRVIIRALRDLFVYTRRWRREAQAHERSIKHSSKHYV